VAYALLTHNSTHMPRKSPYTITLSPEEFQTLQSAARKYTSPYKEVVRAKVILLAAQGLDNNQIGASLSLPRQIVSKWRKRFFQDRLTGLIDQPRRGRPPLFPPELVVAVKALACELPATTGLPLSRFSRNDLVAEVVNRGLVAQISGTTLWRWLNQDAIRPWHHRSWIFPRDPDFEFKAGRVLDLYQGVWEGEPLGPGRDMGTDTEFERPSF
jgi:hypothetical protein